MRPLFEAVLLPPADILILAAVGALLLRARPQLGRALVLCAFLALYILSLPLTGHFLLQTVSVQNRVSDDAQAIVVLSAGLRDEAPEFGGPAPDQLTLERLRYAAYLERKTHLPILVSGGVLHRHGVDLARVMADTLESDYGVPTRWLEGKSLTTAENAKFSAEILRQNHVSRIYLVSHSWHLARGALAFERMGLTVYPAGTGFPRLQASDFYNPVPSIKALTNSYYALHEILGYIWYSMTFFRQAD